MPDSIRPAFVDWPKFNRRLRDVVATLTDEQLALRQAPDRWPLWAVIGHLACQRVFWLCDFAGEPGAETTRFTNAAFDCPGDDDLEHVLSADDLVEALDSTFRIIDRCLDRWTIESLDDEISHPEGEPGRVHSRGFVIGRMYAHDVYHVADVNDALGRAGLAQVDLWE